MKLTSLTSVTFALCGGSFRSRRRAAVSPPKPPPRMSTFQAMVVEATRSARFRGRRARRARPLWAQQERRPFPRRAPRRLAQAVGGEGGGDLRRLLAQQPRDDEPLGRPGEAPGDLEQQRADEVRAHRGGVWAGLPPQ